MKLPRERYACVLLVALGIAARSGSGQIVRIAPIVKQAATPGGSERSPGLVPPASDAQITLESTFFIEVWATNSDEPLDGLACVHVDFFYDKPALVQAVPPAQAGAFFPVDAVTPVFDALAGWVSDVGGCQAPPAIDDLGVDEWVLVERVEMTAVDGAGRVTASLANASNPLAGTVLIGHLENLDPGDIEFQARSFCIGACQPGRVPSSSMWATLIACLSVSTAGTLTLRGRRIARAYNMLACCRRM